MTLFVSVQTVACICECWSIRKRADFNTANWKWCWYRKGNLLIWVEHIEAIEVLLQFKVNKRGETPLILSARAGDSNKLQMIQFHLESISIWIKNSTWLTFTFRAFGNCEIINSKWLTDKCRWQKSWHGINMECFKWIHRNYKAAHR